MELSLSCENAPMNSAGRIRGDSGVSRVCVLYDPAVSINRGKSLLLPCLPAAQTSNGHLGGRPRSEVHLAASKAQESSARSQRGEHRLIRNKNRRFSPCC